MSGTSEISLPLLGQRNYLHGTTLFDVLSAHCVAGQNISFRISRLIESDHVALAPFDPEGGDSSRFFATLVWKEGALVRAIGVTPLTPSALPGREPFDEAAIVSRASFDGSMISTTTQGDASLVRNIVALNKALLLGLLRPPAPGQWLFVRLDLERYFDKFRELRLTQRSSLGFAAVSSQVEIDGARAGMVVFSWVKK